MSKKYRFRIQIENCRVPGKPVQTMYADSIEIRPRVGSPDEFEVCLFTHGWNDAGIYVTDRPIQVEML